MFGGGSCDCDHHVWGTGFRDRGEMESRFQNISFWWRRIVLYPDSNCGVPPFFRGQVRFREWGVYTWRVPTPARAQSAFPWRSNCTTGSVSRGYQRREQHGLSHSWMRAGSSRSHVRAVGIGEVISGSKSGAAICGTDTPLEFLVGVIAGSSPIL